LRPGTFCSLEQVTCLADAVIRNGVVAKILFREISTSHAILLKDEQGEVVSHLH